jgi:hypothetical protein
MTECVDLEKRRLGWISALRFLWALKMHHFSRYQSAILYITFLRRMILLHGHDSIEINDTLFNLVQRPVCCDVLTFCLS